MSDDEKLIAFASTGVVVWLVVMGLFLFLMTMVT